MARTVRDAAIGTRESRLKLKIGKRYFREIHQGLALSYRRGKQGSGTWAFRFLQSDGSYRLKGLGSADDYADADGVNVLSFMQAQKKAAKDAEQADRDGGRIITPSSVAEAAEDYLKWFREHRRSVRETENTINAHILPELGDRKIADLKAQQIQDWLERLAAAPARLRGSKLGKPRKFRPAAKTADEKRARRVTANRVLSVLKALLNRAFRQGKAPDNIEWRKVEPFKKVDQPKIRFLADAEAVRLVNACAPDLRALARGALLTGCRYGELTSMKAQDVSVRDARIYIAESKSGRPRYVPLNPEGVALFRELITGKTGEALVFTKADGGAWGKNHHVRGLGDACKVAKIEPDVAFHELRHTYASALINQGVELPVISKLLGHADMRITLRNYAHLADKTLAAAVTKLPSFGEAVILQPVRGKPKVKQAAA